MTAPERRPEDVPVHTIADLASETGLSERTTRRFFRVLGFPDARDEVGYSEADLATLRHLATVARDRDVDLATTIRLVRAVGQNVARMSDWQVAAIASRAEQVTGELPERGSRHEVAEQIADDMTEAMQAVLVHSWRRHLSASLARLNLSPEANEDATTASVTVGFADLVNFSALSNQLDTNRLGELVEIFEARSGDVVAAQDGRMVKTLGDSVLFLVEDAERAMAIAEGLIDVIGHDGRLPDVRIGLSSGMVVTRMGDVFGPPVNLAARLTALARRNRVIADEATVAGLQPGKYETIRLTARPLRGFGLVEPVAVRRR